MNLPSPDEQLDLHGPRAQLPFEHTPPKSRAGLKSSHDSMDKDKALIASNGVITSGSSQSDNPVSIQQGSLVPPSSSSDEKGPDYGTGTAKSRPSIEECSYSSNTVSPRVAHVPEPPLRIIQDNSNRRPLSNNNNFNSIGFGTFNNNGTAITNPATAHDMNDSPPTKLPRFQRFISAFKRFMSFVGPGYIISVGYMDPGNWATDLAGGSSFGYMLLFIILLSNIMAVVLQGLAVKLGVVSGLDLAQACRRFTPKYINWILYVLAELAIIACDIAEVIGSAVALNLLFKIPLPWGVVITAADVLIILFAFRDDQSVKSRRVFEALVIVLVSCVGICFTAEIAYAKPVAKDVFKGFLPDSQILTNSEALYLAIGIIGATVMPHNLYLHSSIVKLRTSQELTKLASSQNSMSSTQDLMAAEQRTLLLEEDKGAVSVKHSTIRSTLKYTFIDSTVALTFALYVNSAILIVSAATFKYKYPDVDNSGLADFFSAFHLLSEYLGKVAGYVFAVALLMAGQSSTLTATLAGQIIMEGFLGASYLKPWVRRLMTRCLAIIPALVIVIIKGQNGLSGLLLASQVALSLQLPFAVIPLVLFTSMSRCMTIPVEDNVDTPENLGYGSGFGSDPKTLEAEQTAAILSNDQEYNPLPTATASAAAAAGVNSSPMNEDDNGNVNNYNDNSNHVKDGPLLHNFANSWWLIIISGIISFILLGLNFYLLVQALLGI
ncbi:hypothetical protein BGZ46_001675 [Entomortierella lignicola]|nr:hypothetical protein BGZ46_001675 [Entomortierella lignicola]